MNVEDLIYDIKMILTKSNVTDESRFEDRHILHKINNYRSEEIILEYDRTGTINPVWIQDLRRVLVTKVNSADDVNAAASGICWGKVTLPPVVALPNELGIYNLRTDSSQKMIYPETEQKLYLMIEMNEQTLDIYTHYFKNEDSVMIYPFTEYVKPKLILDNPLDAAVVQTEWVQSGSVKSGSQYIVYNYQVVYNGTTYDPGDTITGVAGVSVYTGNGLLKNSSATLSRDIRRRYPCDRAMGQRIAWKVLTQDFALEERKIADLINDAQDQLKLLSSGAAQ